MDIYPEQLKNITDKEVEQIKDWTKENDENKTEKDSQKKISD